MVVFAYVIFVYFSVELPTSLPSSSIIIMFTQNTSNLFAAEDFLDLQPIERK